MQTQARCTMKMLSATQKERLKKERWASAMAFLEKMAREADSRPMAICTATHEGATGQADSCLWRCSKCGELSFGYGDGSSWDECPVCHARNAGSAKRRPMGKGKGNKMESTEKGDAA